MTSMRESAISYSSRHAGELEIELRSALTEVETFGGSERAEVAKTTIIRRFRQLAGSLDAAVVLVEEFLSSASEKACPNPECRNSIDYHTRATEFCGEPDPRDIQATR